MATKEEIVKAALRAYPDNDLIPVDFENMEFRELVEAARKNEFGDTLLSFVVIELSEGTDTSGDDDEADLGRGAEIIDRAVRDLQAVSEALSGMSRKEVNQEGGQA